MTGIIVCDGCGVPFFAHGVELNLPNHLKGLPMFNGIRKVSATESQHRSTSGYTRTAYSKFVDLCQACADKERREKRR